MGDIIKSGSVVRPEAKPEAQNEVAPAGFFERLLAFAIDALLFLIPFQIYGWTHLKTHSLKGSLPALGMAFLFINILFILYCALLNSGGRRTLGKLLMSIGVTDREGEPLPLKNAFKRTLGYYVNSLTLGIGCLMLFINPESRMLNDIIGGSVVLQTREKSFAESLATALTATLLLAVIAGGSYVAFKQMPTFTEQQMIDNARTQLRKLGELELLHHQKYGFYTEDLARLGLISGDPVQFQRDVQRYLSRRDFEIAADKDMFFISARAKDAKRTFVYFP